jgi:NAD-dependent dihydropyrimidine dehydrogenase PreA subunit
MAYVITGRCLGERYGACLPVCPCECMRYGEVEGKPMMVIDPGPCIDCGACLPECPVAAIAEPGGEDGGWAEFAAQAAPLWPSAHDAGDACPVRDPSEPPRTPR